jgi:arylsulfatase
MHEMKFFNGILETPDEAIERIDDIGGPHSHTNYPWGWAHCGNSPFRWYKQNTHEGGVHVPMVVHWPGGLAADQQGSMRRQFVSVSDITPTIYELLGIAAPEVYRGVQQMPVTGRSFAAVLRDPDAPAANTLQYFENAGSRALIAELDGRWWKAVTKHNQGDDFDTEPWELYDLSADPSECNDLAESEPDRLAQLIELWWAEADDHGVLPLDDRTIELFAAHPSDHSPHRLDRRYSYRPPMSPIPSQASASLGGRAFDLTARVTRAEGDDGAIWATGNENSGMSVFVQGDRLVVDYNAFNNHTVVESTLPVPIGDSTLHVHLERDSPTTGWVEVSIDGEACGREMIPFYMRMVSSVGSSVGSDHGSAVSDRYHAPFRFAGELHEVEVQLPVRRSAEARADAAATERSEMSRQ